jgi:hypothetical protein
MNSVKKIPTPNLPVPGGVAANGKEETAPIFAPRCQGAG